MPSLDGATGWLNSEPLRSADLQGRVVLVNFWTLTCINWLRQEPYVRAWSQAYRDDGLIVIGVHTPEFSFEHEIDRVRRAVQERGIDYPVAADNDYAIWTAFDNHYWPALYFVDTDGVIRDDHFGEGRYEQSERDPAAARRRARTRPCRRARRGGGGRLGPPAHPRDLSRLRAHRAVRVAGRRRVRQDRRLPAARAAAPEPVGPGRRVDDRTGERRARPGRREHRLPVPRARRAPRAVPRAREPIPFRVLLDGEAPGPSHGVDVDGDGNGSLTDGRMYQLVRQHGEVRERTLEITFLEPGAEAYVFTFG